MKQFFLCAAVLAAAWPAYGQFPLEYTYDLPTVQRRLVPGAGVGYLRPVVNIDIAGDTTYVLSWFDDNHQPVGQTIAPLQGAVNAIGVLHTSADFFDDDPGIEVAFTLTRDQKPYFRVVDNNGALLVERQRYLSSLPSFFRAPDGEARMLFYDSLYAVPGFQLEHPFAPEAYSVRRTVLSDGSFQYYYISDDASLTLLDGETYEVENEYASGWSINTCSKGVFPQDRTRLNDDPGYEWLMSERCGPDPGDYKMRLFSDETLLCEFESPDSSGYIFAAVLPKSTPGLTENKLILERSEGGRLVYNLGTCTPDTLFPTSFAFRILENSGLKYFNAAADTASTAITILNADYSPWKSVPKPAGQPMLVLGISESTFDNDPSTVEALVRIAEGNGFFTFRVLREDGTVLFERTGASQSSVSALAGYANKLLITVIDNTNTTNSVTEVYSLPSSTPAVSAEEPLRAVRPLPLSAVPNPASGYTRLDLSALGAVPVCITASDALGRVILRRDLDAAPATLELETGNWPAGVYSIQAQTKLGMGTCLVVKQ